jgi:hypothetical protein
MDRAYRDKLLAGLAGERVGDDGVAAALEAIRLGKEVTREDDEKLAIHDEYHRVQDILGFFTTLSLLNADADVVEICNFFYDRWRCPLRHIVHELEEYTPIGGPSGLLAKLKGKRCVALRETFTKLDELFEFREGFDCDEDPFLGDAGGSGASAL